MSPPPLISRIALLSWTKRQLNRLGIRPDKKIGQVFVVDPRLVREIVGHVKEFKVSKVIEVGSGLGTLTYYLAKVCPKVIAVEIDERLAQFTSRLTERLGNVEVLAQDFLKLELEVLDDALVVGNIPYNITSDIIVRVAKSKAIGAIITVQREVADRIMAKPGEQEYGKLTVLTDYIFSKKRGSTYPPHSFYPTPEVFSTILILRRIRYFDELGELLEKLILCAFSERNKLAYKVFKRCLDIDLSEFEWLKRKRVDQLGLEEFMNVVMKLRSLGE